MKNVMYSQRVRKDDRKGGVKVTTYVSKTVGDKGTEYIRFKFMGKDVDWLPYLVAVGISDDGNRAYFIPSEKGFSLRNENKSSSSSVISFAIKEAYRPFIGDYGSLLYDNELNLFYIDRNSKKKEDDLIMLRRSDYDKLMALVEAFQ